MSESRSIPAPFRPGAPAARGGGTSDRPATTDAPSVAIVTLGCGRNEVDSDQLAGLFHRAGSAVIDDPQAAEVVLINTCTFIAPAKQESIDTVLEACQLKDDGAARAVLVVGCMAQRYPEQLAESIPEADAIVGFDGYGNLPQIVDDVLAGRNSARVLGVGPAHEGSRPVRRDLPLMVTPSSQTDTATVDTPAPAAASTTGAGAVTSGIDAAGLGPATVPSADRDRVLGLTVTERVPVPAGSGPLGTGQDDLDRVPASGPRFPVRHLAVSGPARPWAYLKIASGCDRVCTFCAIPSFRGRFRSRPLDEVIAEAAWLAEQGTRELVLVSENTTSWGKDLPGGRDLQTTLLRELSEVDGIERLRLMYLQPAELTTGLLDSIAQLPKVASYYDLSLQHVSGPVVSRMARSGDHARFAELIARARDADPDAVFRSNFILGFPGETDEDVEVLANFLQTHDLDWVGLFPFSREDGTPSADMPDQVPEDVAHERVAAISRLQEHLADEAAARFIGRELDVLIDARLDEDGEPVKDTVADRAATTVGRSYREAPDTDGEIELVGPDGGPVDLAVGQMVRARVRDAVGVDLVAEVIANGSTP